MNLLLRSICGPAATTGSLSGGALKLYTIELPWLDNETDKSCVPAGTYQLLAYFSPTHGRTWRLHAPALNVWGADGSPPRPMRTQIELHSANWCRQLLGCCALGLEGQPMLDPATGCVEPAVENSADAIAKLHELLDGNGEGNSLTIERTGLYSPLST